MNRQQYQDRFRHTNIDPREIERKWQLFAEEQANFQTMMQMMEAARSGAQAVAAVGVGGGGNASTGTPGDSYIITYKNNLTNKIELFTINVSAKTVGPITELDLTTNVDIYYDEIVDGKGYIMIGEGYDEGENGLWFAFVDSAGKVIEFVKNTGQTDWNSYTLEGLSAAISYRTEEGVKLYWWMGGRVFNTTLTNVGSSYNYIYYNWFGYYNATGDGTFSFYYQDESSNNHVWLANAQGNATELNIDGGVDRDASDWVMGVNGNVIFTTYYNTDTGIYDLIRVFETDGTYTDLDLSGYTGDNIEYGLYGTNKFYAVLYPDDTELVVTILSYNTATKSLITTSYDRDVCAYIEFIYTNEPGNLTDYWGSPEGCETLWFMAYSAGNSYSPDQGVYTYDNVKSMCLLDGASSFTEDELVNFTPIWSYSDYAKLPTLFCHRDGETNLELMVITAEGATFGDTGTAWGDAQSYYEVIALGDLVMTTYYDLSQDPTKQSFAIWNGTTKVDEFWTDTDNNWNYNWKTVMIGSYGEGKTYYFTPAAGEWKSITDAYDSRYYADNNGYSDYVGNHRSGITRIVMPSGDSAMLTPDTVTLTTFEIPNLDYVRINGNYLINVYQQGSGDNLYVVEIYDFDGNKVLDFTTYNSSYDNLYVVSDRVIMIQTKPDGSVAFISFLPDYTTQEIVLESGVNPLNAYDSTINDFRWWD